jgi:hypothetical protein
MGISLLCPTRNRPENILRMVKSAYDLANNKNIEFLFYIDLDDNSFPTSQLPENVNFKIFLGERIGISASINKLAKEATNELFFLVGDDVVFKTQNWDQRFIEVYNNYPDGIIQMFPDDGSPNVPRLATHPVLSRKWVETLGYASPEAFQGDYADNWLSEIGDAINRRVFLKDVLVEHMHHSMNKAHYDNTYLEKRERDSEIDAWGYFTQNKNIRDLDVEKLKKVMI